MIENEVSNLLSVTEGKVVVEVCGTTSPALRWSRTGPQTIMSVQYFSPFSQCSLICCSGGRGRGGQGRTLSPPNIYCAPMSGGTLSKPHYEHMQHLASLCIADGVEDWDGIKVITDYAGLPSTNEETKALAPHDPWNFKLQTRPCWLSWNWVDWCLQYILVLIDNSVNAEALYTGIMGYLHEHNRECSEAL